MVQQQHSAAVWLMHACLAACSQAWTTAQHGCGVHARGLGEALAGDSQQPGHEPWLHCTLKQLAFTHPACAVLEGPAGRSTCLASRGDRQDLHTLEPELQPHLRACLTVGR